MDDSPILRESTFAEIFEEMDRRGDVALVAYIKNLGKQDEIIEWRFGGSLCTGIGLCDFMRDQLVRQANKLGPVEGDK